MKIEFASAHVTLLNSLMSNSFNLIFPGDIHSFHEAHQDVRMHTARNIRPSYELKYASDCSPN